MTGQYAIMSDANADITVPYVYICMCVNVFLTPVSIVESGVQFLFRNRIKWRF